MLRLPFAFAIAFVVVACAGSSSRPTAPAGQTRTSSPATAGSPSPTSSPVAASTPTAPPRESAGSSLSHGPAGLVNDLRALGIDADEASEFAGDPISTLGVQLCVEGEPVQVYVYGTPQEAAAVASRIDPRDPSNFGTTIVEWAGEPKFWVRDRVLVLYLGAEDEVEAALVSVLGEPFARGEGRPPPLLPDDC